MASFGQKSMNKLNTCDHHLKILFEEVVRMRDCTILEGRRGALRQNYLRAIGRSQVRFPDSKHNTTPLSEAVDVAPYFADRQRGKRVSFDRQEVIEFGHYVLGVRDALNMTKRIRWGGDWNGNFLTSDENFLDAFHWEVI